jgi:hypothetical protein
MVQYCLASYVSGFLQPSFDPGSQIDVARQHRGWIVHEWSPAMGVWVKHVTPVVGRYFACSVGVVGDENGAA